MTDEELRTRIEEAAEDAEANPNVDVTWSRVSPPKSPTAVYSVRIPVDRIEELRKLAAERGVQPTALIRTWVLAQLDAANDADDQTREWENEVRATIDRLRSLLDQRSGVPAAEACVSAPS
ncbi:hypothetical protein ACFWY9_09090 [Amycolatopsis sp. NPDC059027]|uniref:hypothetical protein n=1 Tax=unclassified Amycolatopsis TaxID=2618356 RepID=UPI003672A491